MRRRHVLVGTLVIVAVTVGAVMFLTGRGSSALSATTITTAATMTGARGGYCIVYPYDSSEQFGGVSMVPGDSATLCDRGVGHVAVKAVGGSAGAGAASRTRYCIEDTEDNVTRHYMFSGHGAIGGKALTGPCPG